MRTSVVLAVAVLVSVASIVFALPKVDSDEVALIAAEHSTTTSANSAVGKLSDLSSSDTSTKGKIVLGSPLPSPIAVFIGPPTTNEATECVPRVEPTNSGLRVWLEEPKTSNGDHKSEAASYLVLPLGAGPNNQYFVGTVTTKDKVEVALPTGLNLGNFPVVFQMIQTTKNGANSQNVKSGLNGYVKTRMSLTDQYTTSGKFVLYAETDEKSKKVDEEERIAYLAIDSGCTTTPKDDKAAIALSCNREGKIVIGGTSYSYEVGVITSKKGSELRNTVSFKTEFASEPFVFANMQTRRGTNPAELRTISTTKSAFTFIVEEDKAKDKEVWHMSELVAYLAIGLTATPTPTPTPTRTGSSTSTGSATPTPTVAVSPSQQTVSGCVSKQLFDDGAIASDKALFYDVSNCAKVEQNQYCIITCTINNDVRGDTQCVDGKFTTSSLPDCDVGLDIWGLYAVNKACPPQVSTVVKNCTDGYGNFAGYSNDQRATNRHQSTCSHTLSAAQTFESCAQAASDECAGSILWDPVNRVCERWSAANTCTEDKLVATTDTVYLLKVTDHHPRTVPTLKNFTKSVSTNIRTGTAVTIKFAHDPNMCVSATATNTTYMYKVKLTSSDGKELDYEPIGAANEFLPISLNKATYTAPSYSISFTIYGYQKEITTPTESDKKYLNTPVTCGTYTYSMDENDTTTSGTC